MHHRPIRRTATVALITLATAAFGACGDDDTTDTLPATTTVSSIASTTTMPTSSTTSSSSSSTTSPSSVAPTTSTPVATVVAWPDAGTTFTTPEAVAADFTAQVFGVGAVLGPFRAGDQRSGEIDVFASDESGRAIGSARSTLLLRQEGDDGSWSVLAAVSEGARIGDPRPGDTVSGVVTVSGRARGFEANVNVRALRRSAPATALDEQTTMGGSLDRLRPYEVDLDLSSASRGDVVLLVVHGGTGLETDPGDTAVIPVVVG